MKKIGIVREEKMPRDRRVAFTPNQCKQIQDLFSVQLFLQPSDWRIIKDSDYATAGITIQEDLSGCDILLGIKEVPAEKLIPNKQYLFFSHTIKQQAHNKKLMQALIAKNICMIDYETLTDENLNRIIGFGHYAGMVGAYNGLVAYGVKNNLYPLKRAVDCVDVNELKSELQKVRLPNLKIIVTGNGRVANGAIELLGLLNLQRITPYEFARDKFDQAVYTQLHSSNYNEAVDGILWNSAQFYSHPENFRSTFMKYATHCDILIHCSYWNPKAPVLFTKQEMKLPNFKIKVIADVTCDINGSIPSTTQASTIANPFYGYDVSSESMTEAFNANSITVMAVDNLPCELPFNASQDFGKELIEKVLPALLKEEKNEMIERATITKEGKLMPRFTYLQHYAQ
jgi:saccharopine dehydrogenase (NAD+, L-lysine forming)